MSAESALPDKPESASEAELRAELRSLMQFVHLAPVGLIQCRIDGRISLMNPMGTQLLAPLGLTDGQGELKLFDILDKASPDLRTLVHTFKRTTGVICDHYRILMPEAQAALDALIALGITALMLPGTLDCLMVVLTDESAQIKLQCMKASWAQPDTLQRFVRDLLEAEMAQMRPSGWPLPGRGQPSHLSLTHDLGADSLELLNLTMALADAASVRDPQAASSLYEQPSLGHWLDMAEQGLRAHQMGATEPCMRFRTSGSTGAPKGCSHTLASLMQEMQAMAQVIRPMHRIVSSVRSHHI